MANASRHETCQCSAHFPHPHPLKSDDIYMINLKFVFPKFNPLLYSKLAQKCQIRCDTRRQRRPSNRGSSIGLPKRY